MREKLENIRAVALAEIEQCSANAQLEECRIKFLGKKGELTAILRGMGALSAEERPIIGQVANDVRAEIEQALASAAENASKKELESKIALEKIDVTMPATARTLGKRHPMSIVLEEVYSIFTSMGFQIAEGPEVEYVYYNFDALNAPQNHPSRDPGDTFYIDERTVLRTQTSPVQVRTMESGKPPIRIIAPGRVYRNDEVDATHSPVFHQIEGLVVDKNVTMGDLKGTLEVFAKSLYGDSTKVRFRPHHFPFTEPSAEMDVTCFKCQGSGCSLCKGEGYIEILGCGMVHPNVLSTCGLNPEIYSGFAFGMGLERIVMQRYKIDDLRLFFENDMRFLSQF